MGQGCGKELSGFKEHRGPLERCWCKLQTSQLSCQLRLSQHSFSIHRYLRHGGALLQVSTIRVPLLTCNAAPARPPHIAPLIESRHSLLRRGPSQTIQPDWYSPNSNQVQHFTSKILKDPKPLGFADKRGRSDSPVFLKIKLKLGNLAME